MIRPARYSLPGSIMVTVDLVVAVVIRIEGLLGVVGRLGFDKHRKGGGHDGANQLEIEIIGDGYQKNIRMSWA